MKTGSQAFLSSKALREPRSYDERMITSVFRGHAPLAIHGTPVPFRELAIDPTDPRVGVIDLIWAKVKEKHHV